LGRQAGETLVVSRELVRQYYAAFGDNEWHRLVRPEGVIEFAVTTHALKKHLPPHGRILDLGGGPGRYSLWLAQRGYRVILADLSPNLLNVARAKFLEAGVQANVENVIVCDACDLSHFSDDSFDAVVCLGPFYHLVAAADRAQAATELVRVLRPSGVAVIAFMPVYTFLRRTLSLTDERRHLAQPEFVEQLMTEGIFVNDIAGRFNIGYGVRPQAVAPFLEQYGLTTVELLADTGFAAAHARELEELRTSDPTTYERVMEIIIDTASDPSLLGGSIHLLYVGQKRA
jgi:ubiquinone/menaquinone biosynthesis C-methylase UbiE